MINLIMEFLLLFNTSLFGASDEFLGPMIRTASPIPEASYELVVSPLFLPSLGEPIYASEVRYQLMENFSSGASFNVWTNGFSLGIPLVWFVATNNAEPEVAVLIGPYFQRTSNINYFSFKISPLLSRSFYFMWGEITPYWTLELCPSMKLYDSSLNIMIKTIFGVQLAIDDLDGLRISLESGISILNSPPYFAIGISYPFLVF